jgi:DNA-binding Lrp family transcriptional regulator
MAVRAYVLIQTEVGMAKSVCKAIAGLEYPGAKVTSADTVTGPYDVIARLEADDLDALGSAVTEAVQRAGGVQHTVTCLAVKLG